MPVAIRLEYGIGSEAGGDSSVQELAAAFERAGEELHDFGKHIFPQLVPVFEEGVGRQFDARGGGSTGSWAPLSVVYAAWKAKAYPGLPLLERTHALRDALTNSTASGAYRIYNSDKFDFGTQGIEYASYHQTGTPRMPTRAVFDFDSQFDKDFEGAAKRGMREAIRASRLEQAGVTVED